jgi:protein-disulfide isomerase
VKKNKQMMIIAGTLFVLFSAFFGAYKLYQANESKKYGHIVDSDFKKLVPDYAPKLGPDSSRVFLVEFLDPECESCREFYPFVKMIMNEFDGNVQLVVRYAPFHQNSKLIIKIIEAARKQGKYWESLELLFHHQPEWGSHQNPKPELVWNYLPQIGLDIDKLKKDMEDPEIQKIIDKEINDANDLGVRMTPSFFVNGKPLESFGYEQLRDMVRDALGEM